MSELVALRTFAFMVILVLAKVASASGGANEPTIDWNYYQKMWLSDLPPARPEEPILPEYDARKAAQFLDRYGVEWTRQNHCGSCHTNLAALMARPSIESVPEGEATIAMRSGLLQWADDVRARPEESTVPLLIATGTALAINDVKSGRPMDRRVEGIWDYVWEHQSSDGSWIYPVRPFLLPFLERDRYYIAMLAALSAGYTPEYFSSRPLLQGQLNKLKDFLVHNPPDTLHHRTVLLWVSARLKGVLGEREQREIARSLLSKQNRDGGWTLAALGNWSRHDGSRNDPHGPSDGYATALVSLALCQAMSAARTPEIERAIAWLTRNQRVSGRWYTPSQFTDGFRSYLSNMATGYAVMALESCSATVRVGG